MKRLVMVSLFVWIGCGPWGHMQVWALDEEGLYEALGGTQGAAQVDTENVSQGKETQQDGPDEEPKDRAVSDNTEDQPLGMNESVTLDLRNIDITDALKFLAVKGSLNITISKNVTGRLALLVDDVPIRDVFEIILRSNELAYEKQGSIFHVMTETEYQARYGRSYRDIRQLKLFRLNYAVPEQVFVIMDSLKSDIGRALVDQESGTAILLDTPEKIIEIERAVASLETRGDAQVFGLQWAQSEDILSLLQSEIDAKNLGSVQSDERSNQLVVRTLPERMSEVAELIKKLDTKTLEVVIDANIIQITLTDDAEQGVEWEGIFEELRRWGTTFIGTHPIRPLSRVGQSQIAQFVDITPTATPTQGSKISATDKIFLGSLRGNESFEILIRYLRTIGDTKLLSNPKLVVVNNEEASILVGRKEAYVTTTTTQGQSTSTVAENVTFVDVGIKLSVTPTINDEGFVTMRVRPEISSVVSTLETPSGNRIPIIETSEAETTVMVKDGTSIIIGGLRKEQDSTTEKRTPYLSRIPFLGEAFKRTTGDDEFTDLMVLLTPHIVTGETLVTGGEMGGLGTDPKSFRDYDTGDDLARSDEKPAKDLEERMGSMKGFRTAFQPDKIENRILEAERARIGRIKPFREYGREGILK